jgi:hypothetical protein
VSDAKKYFDQAVALRDEAAAMKDADLRLTLLEVAPLYDHLARQVEKRQQE